MAYTDPGHLGDMDDDLFRRLGLTPTFLNVEAYEAPTPVENVPNSTSMSHAGSKRAHDELESSDHDVTDNEIPQAKWATPDVEKRVVFHCALVRFTPGNTSRDMSGKHFTIFDAVDGCIVVPCHGKLNDAYTFSLVTPNGDIIELTVADTSESRAVLATAPIGTAEPYARYIDVTGRPGFAASSAPTEGQIRDALTRHDATSIRIEIGGVPTQCTTSRRYLAVVHDYDTIYVSCPIQFLRSSTKTHSPGTTKAEPASFPASLFRAEELFELQPASVPHQTTEPMQISSPVPTSPLPHTGVEIRPAQSRAAKESKQRPPRMNVAFVDGEYEVQVPGARIWYFYGLGEPLLLPPKVVPHVRYSTSVCVHEADGENERRWISPPSGQEAAFRFDVAITFDQSLLARYSVEIVGGQIKAGAEPCDEEYSDDEDTTDRTPSERSMSPASVASEASEESDSDHDRRACEVIQSPRGLRSHIFGESTPQQSDTGRCLSGRSSPRLNAKLPTHVNQGAPFDQCDGPRIPRLVKLIKCVAEKIESLPTKMIGDYMTIQALRTLANSMEAKHCRLHELMILPFAIKCLDAFRQVIDCTTTLLDETRPVLDLTPFQKLDVNVKVLFVLEERWFAQDAIETDPLIGGESALLFNLCERVRRSASASERFLELCHKQALNVVREDLEATMAAPERRERTGSVSYNTKNQEVEARVPQQHVLSEQVVAQVALTQAGDRKSELLTCIREAETLQTSLRLHAFDAIPRSCALDLHKVERRQLERALEIAVAVRDTVKINQIRSLVTENEINCSRLRAELECLSSVMEPLKARYTELLATFPACDGGRGHQRDHIVATPNGPLVLRDVRQIMAEIELATRRTIKGIDAASDARLRELEALADRTYRDGDDHDRLPVIEPPATSPELTYVSALCILSKFLDDGAPASRPPWSSQHPLRGPGKGWAFNPLPTTAQASQH